MKIVSSDRIEEPPGPLPGQSFKVGNELRYRLIQFSAEGMKLFPHIKYTELVGLACCFSNSQNYSQVDGGSSTTVSYQVPGAFLIEKSKARQFDVGYSGEEFFLKIEH